ncbi:phage tail protein [Lacticaseibacillus zeae]|uniref:Phage tail protein n=2 Tax=Lacticaseibacillus zeae TaxID=57037 RepID=A0ABD7Z9L4_LACZE|nr:MULTISPECIES: phage tail protein [Lacticaseibacillus]WLV83707.1 phage tail protein [Lacticaseibacillus sp. NCIMB 15475]WLV86463.1 phage tail protein [Lacticaseibacillus sp. NCIMB 15474]
MEYYFADRKFNILGVGSTDGKGEWRIDNDIETQSVDNRPAVELSLDIHFTTDQEQAVNEMAKATNFIMYQDEEGNAHQMVIESVDHDSLGHIHSIVASDAGNDLINETVGAFKADKPYTIAEYITRFTNDSGWEIGINEFPDNVRTLEWTSEESSLARIISVAKDFDAVLSFGFEFVGTNLVKHVINIRHETAGDSLISFEMNKDINNIVTHLDTYDMETSIKAYGAVPESTNGSTNQDPINLIGYKWTDPTGQFVLDQYGFLHDTIAVQKYSRLLSNSNPNPTQSDWNRVKTFDSKSQAELLQAALADLKKYNHPNETYDIDLVNSPYVPLNQTVHIADENQQLFLSAKVLSIQRSRANHSVQLTLGEFAHETVSFDERLSDLANQMANMPKTIQYYPWVRYADDNQGTNMSAFPVNKKYMAVVYSNKSSVPSDDPADYAGKWALIQGPQGGDGKGSYTHVAYANSIDGKTDFSTTNGNGKMYLGIYADQTQAGSTDPAKYSWALFKGDTGEPGPKGDPGSKDVPYTYIQLGTPASPKKGDLWWHGTTLNDATALQYYDGSTWADQSIQQAVLSIKKLQSIEIDTSNINSPDINSPFNHVQIDGAKSSGNLELKNANLSILGNIEDNNGNPNGQYYKSLLSPNGMFNYITTPDQKGNMSSVALQRGALQLQTLISDPSAATKKYIQSEFTSADNVTFFYVNTTALSNIDIDWAYIYYTRRGNLVTANFQIHTIANQYNFLRLADIRPGYKPYLTNKIVASCLSFSDPGQSTAMYSSTPSGGTVGWYSNISKASGSYGGSVSYLTQDDYPTGDSFFA